MKIQDPDFELILRYKKGDKEAFTELVSKHQKNLYYFILRMISDEEEARDLMQKVLLQCFTHIQDFQFKCKFRTWLYQISVNMVRNHYRQRSKRQTEELEDRDITAKSTPGDLLEERERWLRLTGAIDKLPEKQRGTLMLRIYDDVSFAEIAEIMNCSVGTAKANFHHAVKRLKELIEE